MTDTISNAIDQKLITVLVAEKIRNAIESGEFLPGQRIGETEMSTRFQVSRTPVREAFRILEAEGYLVHSPRCGVVVKELKRRDIVEIFEIRSCLEQLMVRKVVEHISESGLEKLNELADRMENQMEQMDRESFAELDNKFHEFLVANCGNLTLKEMVETLKISTSLIRNRAGFDAVRGKDSFCECQEIIKAINQRDAQAATALMADHFERSLKFFMLQIERDIE